MDDRTTVVIPMAGEAKRFTEKGYHHPKYLLTVRGKPMLQWVLESLALPEANYVFVVRSTHRQTYALDALFEQLAPRHRVVELGAPTEGAACTVLRAFEAEVVPPNAPLIIANCDQWLTWDPQAYEAACQATHVDGGILVTPRLNPQMSFAEIRLGRVTAVAEKRPISPWATCGVYHFTRAGDFQQGAQRMIQRNARVRGEFYVCPVYSELLSAGATILPVKTTDFWGLGTPEDLEEFRLWQCTQRG